MEEDQDFQEIYALYYPKITGYLKRLVGELDAEDAAQEALVKVSQSLDRFRGESSLSTWIYRIATNTAMDHLRKAPRKTRPLAEDDTLSTEGDRIPEDAGPRLDTLLIRKDMNECIRGLVNELPDNYRTVLVLSDLEGFSNTEIGDVLGLSLETVKIRLHRARLALKKSMDHACSLYRDERNELSCDRKLPSLKFPKK
jgi:RNA polymerase sigma-70 factor (ECF subfamily)